MRVQFALALLPLVLATAVEVDSKWVRRKRHGKSSKGSKGDASQKVGSKGGGAPRNDIDCEDKEPHKHGYDDLGIRYNKFQMTEEYFGRSVYLTWKDYPLKEEMAYKLSHYSTGESLVMPGDYEANGVCIEDYIHAIGGYPSFPSSNPTSLFWDELEEVVEAQELRLQGLLPSFFVLPDLWQNFTAAEVAEAVNDEVCVCVSRCDKQIVMFVNTHTLFITQYPGTNHVELIKSLFAEGLEIDHTCIPYRSKYDFVGQQVRMATLNTWSIGAVAPVNFYAKWHVGRPRPEVCIPYE